MITNQNDIAVR